MSGTPVPLPPLPVARPFYVWLEPEMGWQIMAGTYFPGFVGPVFTLDSEVDPNAVYVDPQGTLRFYPPRPSPIHAWDNAVEAWIDPRTQADLDAALAARRAATSLPRREFLRRAWKQGVITEAEAIIAAEGGLPASLQPLIDALPADQRTDARIDWAAATIVERTNPLITAFAAMLGRTPAQIDALFGVPTED